MEVLNDMFSQPKKPEIPAVNVIERLQSGEKFSDIMASVPKEAFYQKANCLCCSDGRFMPENEGQNKLGSAGQEILLLFNLDEYHNFVHKMFSSSNRPEAIASHTGCGAAGLAYKKIQEMIAQGEDQAVADIFNFLEIKNLPETSDKLGEIFTEKLAKEVNAKYYHMFSGESSDHAESGIIISSINFDERYIKAPGQQFFNSSTAIFEAKDGYLKAEISALTNIAFHHGKMSPKSSAYNPNDKFYYLIIADQANAPRLQALAHDLVSNSEFKNRLQIEVFVKE